MRLTKSRFGRTAFVLFVLAFAATSSWAGTTGKIKGVVTDAKTGDPLPGANIVLLGTTMGASTDADGGYLVLNIPPGYYNVRATMIGYKEVTKQGVQVMTDRTMEVNFDMESTVLVGETVVVQAERPMVSRDETNKTSILDFEVFSEMPIQEFDEAVAAQAGIVTDEAGDLHLRGGRAGEIAYMVDGVLVQDPFYKSGASNILLDKYLIQELQVITGAFGAEYGQAMSGIINIVTKEGALEHYSGRIEYESPRLNESPYRAVDWMLHSDLVDAADTNEYRDAQRWFLNEDSIYVIDTIYVGDRKYVDEKYVRIIDTVSTPTAYDPTGWSQYSVLDFESIPGIGDLYRINGRPFHGYFTANFSGPVPLVRNLSFFISNRYSNNTSYLPFGYDSRRELNGKLTYRLRSIKINASIQNSQRYYKPYSHVWKYRPWALEDRRSIIDRATLDVAHTLSPRTFYSLRLSRYYRQFYRWNPNRKFKISDLPEEIYGNADSLDYVIVNGWVVDGDTLVPPSDWEKGGTNSDGFYVRGDRGRYEDNRTTTLTARFDLVSQLTDHHEIKTGFEYKDHHVSRDRWRYPWAGTAHYVEIFEHDPEEFALYLQDKMEYKRFVINVGLRYDYFDAHHTMWGDSTTREIDIYTPGTLDDSTLEWIPAEEIDAKPQKHFSPRLGIAYPVTDRMVFHSSYGHFYEIPSFYEMYKHHDVTAGGIPLVGNPSIKSQKTIQYEFGVKMQLGFTWVFDVNAYFKDITNLAASSYRLVFPYNFTVFDNTDYASVRGIDITLERRRGRFFTGIFNYTFSVAKGNESSSRDGYSYYRGVDVTLRPNREFYLDFDRRHDLSISATFKTPSGFGPKFAVFRPLAQWNLNLLVQVASGLPYTPFVEEEAENVFVEKNTGRKPGFAQVDLRLQKTFTIAKNLRVAGFLVVDNLFNRLNTNYVWTRTGKAWEAGPTSRSQDRIHNPEHVDSPRQISVGFRYTL